MNNVADGRGEAKRERQAKHHIGSGEPTKQNQIDPATCFFKYCASDGRWETQGNRRELLGKTKARNPRLARIHVFHQRGCVSGRREFRLGREQERRRGDRDDAVTTTMAVVDARLRHRDGGGPGGVK